MTLRGSATLELSFLIEDERLQEVGVESPLRFASSAGCALTKQERDAVWCALPEWLQEKLMDQSAANAEQIDDDDSSCDDARISGEP